MPMFKQKVRQRELQENLLLLHKGIRERYAEKSMKVDRLRKEEGKNTTEGNPVQGSNSKVYRVQQQ